MWNTPFDWLLVIAPAIILIYILGAIYLDYRRHKEWIKNHTKEFEAALAKWAEDSSDENWAEVKRIRKEADGYGR